MGKERERVKERRRKRGEGETTLDDFFVSFTFLPPLFYFYLFLIPHLSCPIIQCNTCKKSTEIKVGVLGKDAGEL